MKILFAADILPDPNSGAAGTEYQTLKALKSLGYDIHEIWADKLPRRIQHGNLHYLLELPYLYRSAIRNQSQLVNYDVYHINQGHCYLAAKDHHQHHRYGVFVLRSHGLDDHMDMVLRPWRRRMGIDRRNILIKFGSLVLSKLLYRNFRTAYIYSSGVLVSSSMDKEYLIENKLVPRERIACITQAPSLDFVSTEAPSMYPGRLNHILHVGGFAYWKGVHAVARAVNILLQRTGMDNVRMTWICDEKDHEQVKELLDPQVIHKVRIQNWVSQEELKKIYDQHGILVSPSLFEGFGKVFLEAMSRGLCVVGTRTGGMRDVITSGHNGLLVNFNDSDAIVREIEQLWSDPQQAEKISRNACMEARKYSWSKVAGDTMEFYKRLISMGPRKVTR